MTFLRTSPIPSLVLAAALLGACGGGDDTAADAPTTTGAPATSDTTAATTGTSAPVGAGDRVTMEDSRFAPDPLEVAVGTEVTFENTDPYAHTVTSAEGSPTAFDSGELNQDETFSQTFDEPGTYPYFCQIHPTMRAEVVVS